MMQCKKLFMVDKETSDITGNTPPLYPAIEYHPCVVLVTYRRDDYKYTQFEGDNRLEDSYKYYVELVKENSNLFIRMIDDTNETDIT